MQQIYTISGMHCGACVAKLTKALEPLVTTVKVTLSPPQAVVTSDQPIPLKTLHDAAASAGAYKLALYMGTDQPAPATAAGWLKTYRPLLLIAAYLAIIPLASGGGLHGWMTGFMAGFFLVFSFFKLLDLDGFADAYASYDLLARRWKPYGYIYPFLELGLGLAYAFQLAPVATHVAALVLMGFSSLGVIAALREKRPIRCACLGTVLNLPMTTVTLVEDVLMMAMALAMLLFFTH